MKDILKKQSYKDIVTEVLKIDGMILETISELQK
jgi:hypothetical protein